LSGDIHSLRSELALRRRWKGRALPTSAKYVWEGNTHSTSSGQAYYSPLIYSMLGGAWRYHMYDGLGSTRQLMLHTDQSITDTYQYEAFGNLTASTGTTPNPYRYVGSLGYYQTGSSLMHLGARYYMPEVAIFTEPDPAEVARDPRDAYTYSRQNPTNAVDPAGLWCISWTRSGRRMWVGTGPREWWGWQWVMERPPVPAGGGKYVCYWMKCFVTRQSGYWRWKVTQWTLCCEGICCTLKKDSWYERTEELERVNYTGCKRGYTTQGMLVENRYVICEPPSGSPE
jgi:RHS repeat-associated protein